MTNHPNLTSRQFSKIRAWLLVTILLILVACHLPLTPINDTPDQARRQTEAAGILNPDGLGIPVHDPKNIDEMPAASPPGPTITWLEGSLVYTTQQGDTLPALAKRFDTPVSEMVIEHQLHPTGLLPIGIQIHFSSLPDDILLYHTPIFPDSEVTYGPSVGEFNADRFARETGGYLAEYSELVRGERMDGPQIVQQVAVETSTNPRLLLAFLEYRSGWVFDHPTGAEVNRYPIGYNAATDDGLYRELMITARLLAQGFYGWRDGSRLHVNFHGGGRGRLSPGLNAGSSALMTLFAAIYRQEAWEVELIDPGQFLLFYNQMFGDAWERAALVEPYLLPTVIPPDLALPFAPGERWSLTGGPHLSWQTGTPRGALDFAPITGEPPCAISRRQATAAAAGQVVRSERAVVALDLDGDGDEGTGWVLVYMHIAEQGRGQVGEWLAQDAPLGHPSCEGGQSSGTHLHLARKFNGEWLGVDEPFPMVLSGWQAFAGAGRYEGYLQKGGMIVTSRPDGSSGSTIIRDE